ncbi:MAG: hypothetical protein ACR2HG_01095 [Pyrinomonadaceae bacterium]
MVLENTYDETEIRRFLLGEMPEDERSAFEARFVADESLFEQISASEDELIESYVRGTLSPDEKQNFEREFLSTELRRRRVAFARTMLDKINVKNEIAAAKKTETAVLHQSVWDSIGNFFKTPKLAFGAAFAILILAFGFWLLVLKSSKNDVEIAKQITPTPTAEIIEPNPNQNALINQNNSNNPNTNTVENIPENRNDLPNTNRATPKKNRNPDIQKQNSKPITPILALFAGSVCSEGKMSELNLPKNAAGANLQLNLESQDYKIYQVEIVNPDGNSIFKNGKLKARNSKINFFIPAQKLPIGDYIVKLSALNLKGETESVADYSFRVSRK